MGGTLRRTISLSLALLAMGAGGLRAEAEPDGPPSRELVRKLLADEAEVLERTINVGIILPGTSTSADGFEASRAVRVIYLWDEERGNLHERVVAERIFFWNEDYGWFTWGKNTLHGHEVLDICSEKKGLIRLR